MSEVSEINIPHVIDVLGVSGISEKDSPSVPANVLEKCGTSGASLRHEQVNQGAGGLKGLKLM